MYDDYDDYDSLMDETDDVLFNEEDERMIYECEVNEINEYWDRENEYIKSSGIYTKEEEEEAAYNAYRAYREEQAAYDDFIASLDMGDE